MNVNIFENDPNAKRHADMLRTHNMCNHVDFPTRISATKSSCLDHVYSNLSAGGVHAEPVHPGRITDHLAMRVELLCSRRTAANSARYARAYTHFNKMNFVACIESVDWGEVKLRNQTSADMAVAIINIISNKFDICFPSKIVQNKKHDSSWVTPDVKDYKLLLFDILKISETFPDIIELNEIISNMNNYYDILIRNAKSNFYSNKLNSSSNSSRTMWTVVNNERGKNNSPHIDFTQVVKAADGLQFNSKQCLVNEMNARFLSAARTCGAPRAAVGSASAVLSSARAPADRSLRFKRFSADEVHKIITCYIPPKTSKDVYGVTMKLIRLAAIPLSPLLADLYNMCIEEGSFPTPLKVAKVSPLYKGKGKRDCIDNYRPVSIIPAVAKVFEHGISSRLTSFLAESCALSDRQYAYREGRSTTYLAREVIRRVMAARDSRPKQHVALLCCDLSKAFDVADRTVLEAKLRHYGVDGPAHALLSDLMRNRSQLVVGEGGAVRSDPLVTTMGVAQGSSISNILFSLLLNDLPDAVPAAEIYMFADDVAAVTTGSTIDQLEAQLNATTLQLARWFRVNGLALNLKKTHYIHFYLAGKVPRPLAVFIDSVRIEQVSSTAFLGFELDRGLQWEKHVDKVCGKLGSACFALFRLSRVVPPDVVRCCYFATVHSVLQYGAELWGRAADWERAFRMQKRAVRAIARIPPGDSARPHFKRLGILTLPSLVIYQVAVYVRQNLFSYTTCGTGNHMSTRFGSRLKNETRTLKKSSKITHIVGPTIYNKILPETVKLATSLASFKARLKCWLIEETFYDYDMLKLDI